MGRRPEEMPQLLWSVKSRLAKKTVLCRTILNNPAWFLQSDPQLFLDRIYLQNLLRVPAYPFNTMNLHICGTLLID